MGFTMKVYLIVVNAICFIWRWQFSTREVLIAQGHKCTIKGPVIGVSAIFEHPRVVLGERIREAIEAFARVLYIKDHCFTASQNASV